MKISSGLRGNLRCSTKSLFANSSVLLRAIYRVHGHYQDPRSSLSAGLLSASYAHALRRTQEFALCSIRVCCVSPDDPSSILQALTRKFAEST
jgi:hypothetical protein